MRSLSRGWIYALSAVGAVLVVLIVLLANLQWFRGPIERAVASATGREAHIRGEIKLSPELVDYRLYDLQDLKCWPAGTGFALAEWLRSRGHEPEFVEWPRPAAPAAAGAAT
jgi:hypothetical protein